MTAFDFQPSKTFVRIVESYLPKLSGNYSYYILWKSSTQFYSTPNLFILHFKFFSADPLVASIAQQYISNREEHDEMAKEWTKRFAT